MTPAERTRADECLARWFLARSDLDAATSLNIASPLVDYIARFWPQYTMRGLHADIYKEAGRVECETPLDLTRTLRDPRYMVAANWLNDRMDVRRILDFGCARGHMTIALAKVCGRQWIGHDISRQCIEAAEVAAKEHLPDARTAFVVGDVDRHTFDADPFDAAFAFDILEHVADPFLLLSQLSRSLNPGSWILCAVPGGPVEYPMWIEQPERNREHLREWTAVDVNEIFGKQTDFGMVVIEYGPNKYLKMDMSHTVFWYRPGNEPLGNIDWERKLKPTGDIPLVALPA